MCLIAFSFQYPINYHLIVAANRDEFFNRKTAPANYWEEDTRIWGGKDLEGGGTWMGVREDGRFAFLTNYRNLHLVPISNPISRGQLVREFLISELEPKDYIQSKKEFSGRYEGFNLVVGDLNTALYWNNKLDLLHELQKGIYTISNGTLLDNWYKTDIIKDDFQAFLDRGNIGDREAIFQMLKNGTRAPKSKLPDTGIGEEKEWALSSPFIELPGYGTRSSTYVALKMDNTQESRKVAPIVLEERVWV
ncbi:MAG: NRDE family protein [Leptospira sp.]|nr:NRDE family protein [Leptospira sp.]